MWFDEFNKESHLRNTSIIGFLMFWFAFLFFNSIHIVISVLIRINEVEPSKANKPLFTELYFVFLLLLSIVFIFYINKNKYRIFTHLLQVGREHPQKDIAVLLRRRIFYLNFACIFISGFGHSIYNAGDSHIKFYIFQLLAITAFFVVRPNKEMIQAIFTNKLSEINDNENDSPNE